VDEGHSSSKWVVVEGQLFLSLLAQLQEAIVLEIDSVQGIDVPAHHPPPEEQKAKPQVGCCAKKDSDSAANAEESYSIANAEETPEVQPRLFERRAFKAALETLCAEVITQSEAYTVKLPAKTLGRSQSHFVARAVERTILTLEIEAAERTKPGPYCVLDGILELGPRSQEAYADVPMVGVVDVCSRREEHVPAYDPTGMVDIGPRREDLRYEPALVLAATSAAIPTFISDDMNICSQGVDVSNVKITTNYVNVNRKRNAHGKDNEDDGEDDDDADAGDMGADGDGDGDG